MDPGHRRPSTLNLSALDHVAGPTDICKQSQRKRPTEKNLESTAASASDVTYNNLDDLKSALQDTIDNAPKGPLAEKVSCVFVLSGESLLAINFPPEQHRRPRNGEEPIESPAWTVRELCDIVDPKERRIWQRGAARGLLTTVQDVDGFRYTVNNNWSSKDDAGFRFSYTCLDSLENKDRQANNPRRSRSRQQDLGPSSAEPRGIRKETYDCKGQVAVKFSGARHVVELVYKHTALHRSYKDLASLTKHHLTHKGRLFNEDGSSLTDAASETSSFHDSATAVPLGDFARNSSSLLDTDRRKRSRINGFTTPRLDTMPVAAFHPDDSVSLAELLRQPANKDQAPPALLQQPVKTSPLLAPLPSLAPIPALSRVQPYHSIMNLPNMTAPSQNPYVHTQLPLYIPQHQASDHRSLTDFMYSNSTPAPHSQSHTPGSDLVHQIQNRHAIPQNLPNELINPMNSLRWFQNR